MTDRRQIDSPEDSQPPEAARKSVLDRLQLRSLLGLWSAFAFLVAVARLLMLRGIQPGILCLFLLPVLLALVSRSSERLSTRVVATGFLTLIDCGHLLAPHPWLFPNLPQIDQNLGQADNRILGWYALMYLLYGFVIFPPFLFGRGILDRRTGRAEFTLFTNVLGLVGWFVTAPGFIWISVDQLGLWPIVRW